MSFGTILYTLLIRPLELVFEVIYSIANGAIANPGLSIIALSLAMNFLVLPLYMRADALQMEEQEREKKLSRWTTHIRKTFKGDERLMMQQAYYREVHYKPIYALKGSFSLLLEIPFFIAAYHFLSHLELLKGVSFGPIADLGSQDALIHVGGISINLLPVLMTTINIVSSLIYSKGSPLKTKVQLSAMALIFLVFLYKSPSGLVFYWTLNNTFSLLKNIFYKLKNPRKILCIMASYAGVFLAGMILTRNTYTLRAKTILLLFCVVLQIPLVVRFIGSKHKERKEKISVSDEEEKKEAIKQKAPENSTSLQLASSIYLAVLIGLLIGSQVIVTSTGEFMDISNLYNPVSHVITTFILAIGLFVVWLGVFYYLMDKKARNVFSEVLTIVAVVASIDYMFFGRNLGNLSPRLQFDNQPAYGVKETLINTAVIIGAALITHIIIKKANKLIIPILAAAIVATGAMSIKNISTINKEYNKLASTIEQSDELPTYTFSKNGKNVVILMMDRMISQFIPYIMEEKPELKESFDGFTYYPNSMSYASTTNAGLPGVFGGYEYIPTESNKRDDVSLMEKQNEALKLMPVLFDEAGYNVTVCDPTYANYNWIPDLSIYDDYPEIHRYITMGNVEGNNVKTDSIKRLLDRNLFCYSLFKSVPVVAQTSVYNGGNYYSTDTKDMRSADDNVEGGIQTRDADCLRAEGVDANFIKCYNVLDSMSSMTSIEESGDNFMMMCNEIVHCPTMLQLPDYVPAMHIDNTQYGAASLEKTDANGNHLSIATDEIVAHYCPTMAAFINLGEWFDYLKEQGVYDNTKIIIVSDHSWPIDRDEALRIDGPENLDGRTNYGVDVFNCTLMVKDYNAKGFTVDETFMTNADTPTLAMQGNIDNPVNPFTGKAIENSLKNEGPQDCMYVDTWEIDKNNGNTYLPATWFQVDGDVRNGDSWKSLGYY